MFSSLLALLQKSNGGSAQGLCMSRTQGLSFHLSNQKPGHITGGSVWSDRRSGRAESGKIACQQNYSLRKQKFHRSLRGIEEMSLPRLSRNTTSEILCKPAEERNQRLTTGYPRFITGTRSALCFFGCRTVQRGLFVAVNMSNLKP